MRLMRASAALFTISFRRMLWSSSTLMVGVPLALAVVFLLRRRYDLIPEPGRAFNEFSEFLLFFTSFFVPICALAYCSAGIGGDREDRTLLFLLIRPVPRPVILLAKFAATLPLTIGVVVASLYGLCRLAGAPGMTAFHAYLPAVFYSSVAYASLFTLFAVSFRHATVLSLAYALFMELFLGNMPGIVKRIAINFYARSLMFAAGTWDGLEPPDPRFWFLPLAPTEAAWTLVAIAAAALAAALVIFSRREYRDLS